MAVQPRMGQLIEFISLPTIVCVELCARLAVTWGVRKINASLKLWTQINIESNIKHMMGRRCENGLKQDMDPRHGRYVYIYKCIYIYVQTVYVFYITV